MDPAKAKFTPGRDRLTVHLLSLASRGELEVVLDDATLAAMAKSRDRLERDLGSGREVYGVTTGFGEQGNLAMPSHWQESLQEALYTFHRVGVGPLLAPEWSRAVLLVRLHTLCLGYSGVRPVLVEQMARLFSAGVTPAMPARGSVGASGDLTPLSYLAALVAGEGQAWQGDRLVPAWEALSLAGVLPLCLQAKEALAIMNGTAVMTALAALAVDQSRRLLGWLEVASALAVAASDADRGAYSSWAMDAKPHPGQGRCAGRIRDLAFGGEVDYRVSHTLPDPGTWVRDRNIQARYSLRCVPQVLGVLADTLDWVEPWILTEANSANDNPLFRPEDGEVFHGGHFYGGHVVQATDALRLALAHGLNLADRQVQLLLDPKTNQGLGANLARLHDPARSPGPAFALKALGITTSALAAEIQHLAAPVGLLSRPTESGNQDVVSLGTLGARKTLELLDLGWSLAAHGLVVGTQALERREALRGGAPQRSDGLKAAMALVRGRVPAVEGNAALGTALEALAERLRWEMPPVGSRQA